MCTADFTVLIAFPARSGRNKYSIRSMIVISNGSFPGGSSSFSQYVMSSNCFCVKDLFIIVFEKEPSILNDILIKLRYPRFTYPCSSHLITSSVSSIHQLYFPSSSSCKWKIRQVNPEKGSKNVTWCLIEKKSWNSNE